MLQDKRLLLFGWKLLVGPVVGDCPEGWAGACRLLPRPPMCQVAGADLGQRGGCASGLWLLPALETWSPGLIPVPGRLQPQGTCTSLDLGGTQHASRCSISGLLGSGEEL